MIKLFNQLISFVVTVAFLIVQTFWLAPQAWADEFNKAANTGEETGRSLIPDAQSLFSASEDGSITLYPGSQNATQLDANELFPTQDGSRDITDLKDSYGNNGQMLGLGQSAHETLQTEESLTGEAYRTVIGSAGLARPNMSNDPIFNQSDQVLGNLGEIKSEFSDCQETTNFVPGTKSVHVPDLKQCTKVFKYQPQTCVMTQEFKAETGNFTVKGGIKSGYRAVIEFDLINGTATKGAGTDPKPNFAAQAPKLDYNDLCKNGKTEFKLVSIKHWDNPPSSIRNKNDTSVSRFVIQYPTCENGLKGIVQVNDTDINNYTLDDWDVNGVFNFQYVVTNPSNTWLPKSCVDLFYTNSDKLCDTDYEIFSGAQNPDDCLTISGTTICPGSTAASGFNHEIPELPLFSTGVKVVANGCDFNIGDLECYTDINGVQQCPTNDGSNPDTCGEYEENPSCAFVSSECVDGALGESGTCYVTELTYDCGYSYEYETIEKETQLDCAGPIKCMGEECVTVQRTASADFSRAAASLQAAKFVGMDANCVNENNCNVFEGKSGSCKKAVGGYVDCCKTPSGFSVSIGDYIRLASAVGQLNDAVMTLDSANAVRGAWQGLSEPFTSAWGEVNSSFTSAWEGMWGGTETVTEAGTEAASAGVKQALMQETAQWTAEIFGDGAANMLFSNAAGNGAAVVGGEVTGEVALGGGEALIGTALSWIMVAYTVYVVATILIKMIFKCEQQEFELVMKRELKSCHYVGSYCSKKLNLWFKKFCIETRTAYCCFNSPISRILQEQIRPQLGMSWGSPEGPNCSGIPVARLEDVNWEQVNLDEWIGLLGSNNLLPNASNINIESLTGSGSLFNTDGSRKNASERTVERLEGVDTTGVRTQAREELQGSILFTD